MTYLPQPTEILDFDPDESENESELIRFCMDSGGIYSDWGGQDQRRRKPHLWEETGEEW
jgi:hypothetical protein